MPSMNAITIGGKVTGEPRRFQTSKGKTGVSFRLAFHQYGQPSVGFVNVTAWSPLADRDPLDELAAGDRVIVHGRIRFSEWIAADGSKRGAVDITAQSVQELPPTPAFEPDEPCEPSESGEVADVCPV